MHLQQTKATTRTGGPQYYFHDLSEVVKDFLRPKGACPVVLHTPYGITKSNFMAVGKDHKLTKGKVGPGSVGHDRIQGGGEQSIGEAIRYWYGLPDGLDFERIDVEATIHPDGHFIVIPTTVTMRGKSRPIVLEKIHAPLSFHHDYQSKLWRDQISLIRKTRPDDVVRAAAQINRVIADHRAADAAHILESDLLRAAGAFALFGLDLSAYLGKGYDCVKSQVQFGKLPLYPCPVELKKRSRGFSYQVVKYTSLPRAVVLCMDHDYINPPDHIDIIELATFGEFLGH